MVPAAESSGVVQVRVTSTQWIPDARPGSLARRVFPPGDVPGWWWVEKLRFSTDERGWQPRTLPRIPPGSIWQHGVLRCGIGACAERQRREVPEAYGRASWGATCCAPTRDDAAVLGRAAWPRR